MKKTLLTLLSVLFCAITFAQSVPQGINYQAVARDGSGDVLMNQALLIQFSVISDITTSAISWQETHTVNTNDYGLYTAIIGGGTATSVGSSASFDVIDWGASNHLLKVEVDFGSGYLDMGTTAFMSVPYALYGEDEDADSNNELQSLSISGDTLFISSGNSIVIPGLSLINSLIVQGCTDSTALNYNSLANTDNGYCIAVVLGCTDSTMFNYNSLANTDNGYCIAVVLGCTDSTMFNYNALANTDDGSCGAVVLGCTDSTMFNYNALANTDDGSCIVVVLGCTDPTATNYNALANMDDGSCIAFVYGCMDSTMFNYNALANTDDGSCIVVVLGCTDATATNYNALANMDDGSCVFPSNVVYGCTDPTAINYNSLANTDDSTCYYCSITTNITPWLPSNLSVCDGFISVTPTSGTSPYTYVWSNGNTTNLNLNLCDGVYTYTVIDDNGCGFTETIILTNHGGCTDSLACNYDATALINDGSCLTVYGCTDSLACNYDATATCDDGTCLLTAGCIDSSAYNYDATATCDDGSCIPFIFGCMDIMAYNYNLSANTDDGTCLYCDISVFQLTVNNNTPGLCDGWALLQATSSYPPVTYSWNNGFVGSFNTSLCMGIYSATMTDTNGCSIDTTFNVGNVVLGCTNPNASNYDPLANFDDGFCCIDGCTDSTALNYDATATCDNGSCAFAIGDSCYGGIIFYLDGNGGGLIAAPYNQPMSYWGCYGTNLPGAAGAAIGAGAQNTIDIINANCTSSNGSPTAADWCANLTLGGYSDWFLPSRNELIQLVTNLNISYSYWSSTEAGPYHAYSVVIGNTGTSNGKSSLRAVRAIRAF